MQANTNECRAEVLGTADLYFFRNGAPGKPLKTNMLNAILGSDAQVQRGLVCVKWRIPFADDQQERVGQPQSFFSVSQGIQAIRDAASLTVHEIEKTSSAAQEMQSLSEGMEVSVGQFRCDDEREVLPKRAQRKVRSRALALAAGRS